MIFELYNIETGHSAQAKDGVEGVLRFGYADPASPPSPTSLACTSFPSVLAFA
jgi:hypothetical protein